MKILEQEVKTVYTISITREDFEKASIESITNPLHDISCEKAFKEISSWEEFKSVSIFNDEKNKIITFICTEVLNFSRVENSGYFEKESDRHIVVVSNKGDCINE